MNRIILLLLLTGATTASALQSGAADGPPAANSVARRSPDAATLTLRGDLERLISGAGWRGDAWSVMVVSLDRGDTLFDHRGSEPLAPASNVKLYTSAAALYYLGPDFRFNTFLLAEGPVRDSVLEGDLVLYGTGDPTIAVRFGTRNSVWEAFADSVQAAGIREIRGAVVGDASYFRGSGTGEGWQSNYIDASYAAPASALSYAENIATIRIRPGEQAGWRPEVTLIPGGEGIGIVNEATTVQRGATTIRVFRSAYGGPLTVQGQIPRTSSGVLRAVPVSDPARYAAAVFREVLEKRGVVVSGGVRSAERAEDSPLTGRTVFAPVFDQHAPVRMLAVHNSPPLSEILEVVNKKSHNLYAEQVVRAVGRVAAGDGSVEGGVKAIHHMLEQERGGGGLNLEELKLYDGSGLSALNRSSAGTFIQLLAFAHGSPIWASFWETLPEAGARDGLRRMGRTSAERNLRAKTGTINRVSALSGYVRAANGERLAFSILSNNVPSTWRAKRIEDAIGARLAAFSRARDVGEAAPSANGGGGDAPANGGASAPSKGSGTAAPVPVTPAASSAPVRAAAPRIHEVARGETLDGIARRYGVTVEALRAANGGVEPRRLLPGTRLDIPEASSDAPSTTSAAPAEYAIRPGDTLEAIAKRHGTTVEALRAANPGLNPRRLIPGRRIRLR